jgi:hypothetical protein
MEEKTSTLNSRQTGTYHYDVTLPETGATKTAPTLDSALTIILHDILKHLTTHSLILVLADHHADRAVRSVDPQERPQTDPEYQGTLKVVQLGIALQLKRRERDLSRPLTREQATWLDEHVGKLVDSYCIKDELEVQLDALLEEARDNRKAAAHE